MGFDLVAADGRPLPPAEPGAHIDVHVPGGFVRQYSLCAAAKAGGTYTVAVKKDEMGRGGSVAMHRAIENGTIIGISEPRNFFPLHEGDHSSLFVAGGIGITPIRMMIAALQEKGRPWELHYCARSPEHAAFHDELAGLGSGRVHTYFSETPLLDAGALLAGPPEGTHLYCCGPEGLMRAVETAAAHWPADQVHFEWFTAPLHDREPAQAFEVELKRSGLVLAVPVDKSILQVLRANGIEAASTCEEGVCGSCETRVLAGEPDHRDVLLSPEEKAANKTMMICVSRARGGRLILDI